MVADERKLLMKWETASLDFKRRNSGGITPLHLGEYWNSSWARDPKSVLFMLSRYKFVAKLLSNQDKVLEVGCGEGLGAPLLSASVKSYTGVDRSPDLVDGAQERLSVYGKFTVCDVLESTLSEKFDACVSLDVIEHVFPAYQGEFIERLTSMLNDSGVIIIGSPSLESQSYASEVSKAGHVGCLTAEEQYRLVKSKTRRAFNFSMNDELVHTGFSRMSNYNFTIGII